MRAKNEAKFLSEAYKTVILERVVDGVLMCPEACCGKPVMECECPPDCQHCNCFMIQKAVKKYGLEDKLLQKAKEDEEVHLRGTNFAAEPPPVDEEVRLGNTWNDRFRRLD